MSERLDPERARIALGLALRVTRKIAVALVGAMVLVTGVLMLVLPGPAFVVIPAGLAILALEFAWARRWMTHVKEHGSRALGSLRSARS